MSSRDLTTSAILHRAGIAEGAYPERALAADSWLFRAAHVLQGLTHNILSPTLAGGRPLAAMHHHGRIYGRLDTVKLAEAVRSLRRLLHHQGLTDDLLCQAFALIRETAGRTINMRHYDRQLEGGWIMAHGQLAEMATGEGKTLTATLAAAAAGLAGLPVHVITVNEYLASRDAKTMGPLYQALGLSVGVVTETMPTEERRRQYSQDIVYGTNKQFAFDYLRDRMILGNDQGRLRLRFDGLHDSEPRTDRLFLRGLCYAIVDEADSVLVDEARTPLIISNRVENPEEETAYRQAIGMARSLVPGIHFSIDPTRRQARLSDAGGERLTHLASALGGPWQSGRQREELILQALAALHLHERDRHYIVHDGKVVIVDENTGRTMADRSWERGLHQMVEIKENCPVSGRNEQLARLTYQRFFRRYRFLAGMSGTLREIRRELWSVYHLKVVPVAPQKPCRRRDLGEQVHADAASKWAAIVDSVRRCRNAGQPVLVGTRTVADSEHVSRLLHLAGIDHQMLNARQDAEEALVVARAGHRGQVTVATNMAGRGTDIVLGPGVAELGGLHVIVSERNDARRIDRQLVGRSGRQGDPGSFEVLLSLEDELPRHHLHGFWHQLLTGLTRKRSRLAQTTDRLAIRSAQAARERQHRAGRRALLRFEDQVGRLLAFSGRME